MCARAELGAVSSIEFGRESSVRMMRKQPVYLTQGNSRPGELREFTPAEERHLACLQAWGGTSSYKVTQEERLVHMEQHGGMLMLVPIIQRDHLTDLRLKPRLLPYFPYHCLSRGLPDISPPPWERP